MTRMIHTTVAFTSEMFEVIDGMKESDPNLNVSKLIEDSLWKNRKFSAVASSLGIVKPVRPKRGRGRATTKLASTSQNG